MWHTAVLIEDIEKGSPAQLAGLLPGMRLISLEGHEINDGLDYEFYSSAAKLPVVIEQDGEQRTIVVHKEEYQPLGCVFASYLIDKQHSCKNKCVFCFIDQMPKGMRPSLYFKDDDERLSFLFGNYVTLTNLTDKEVQRVIDMKISPINISVHTVNPELRVEMMKNRYSGDVLRYIPQLAEAGISLNTQLVLCPGLNDGEELRRSIEWLSQFRPSIQSIAAVPVGLTKYRDALYPLRSYTKEEAAAQLDIMLEYGNKFAAEGDIRLVYPSDEWFLLAGRDIPQEDFYDGYMQLENGVGMWRLLHDEFSDALEDVQSVEGTFEVDLATGVLAAPLLQQLADKLHAKFSNVTIYVHTIKNDFFGHGVTVAGLVTGRDIIYQLKSKLHTQRLLLPEVMLRAEEDVFLDDITPADVERELGATVEMIAGDGQSLLEAVLQIEE